MIINNPEAIQWLEDNPIPIDQCATRMNPFMGLKSDDWVSFDRVMLVVPESDIATYVNAGWELIGS